MLYTLLVRPILFLLDPESAHTLVQGLSRTIAPFSGISRALFNYSHPSLRTKVFGIEFENPVGLAPGYDKDGRVIPLMDSLGFGFLEIGTVTPLPQPGNPKPRLFRLPADSAIINRMGFNGLGAEVVRKYISESLPRAQAVIGINIGKNKVTPNESAADDYAKAFEHLADVAKYAVINVSSPNTPNIRDLQQAFALKEIIGRVQEINRRRVKPIPILVKIAPDLSPEQLDHIVDTALAEKLDGIVATNTTISRDNLLTPPSRVAEIGAGGLSGKPVKSRSTEMIRRIFLRSHGKLPIIGVGGIFSAEDAYEKIKAGASLVQVYTGLIYEGPNLAKKIKKGLVQLLSRDGFQSVKEAVGASATQ